MQRRNFLASSLVLPTAVASAAQMTSTASRVRAQMNHGGKFKISLKADAIGVEGSADELLDAAIKYGYEALSVPAQWLEGWDKKEKQAFHQKAIMNDISWGQTACR